MRNHSFSTIHKRPPDCCADPEYPGMTFSKGRRGERGPEQDGTREMLWFFSFFSRFPASRLVSRLKVWNDRRLTSGYRVRETAKISVNPNPRHGEAISTRIKRNVRSAEWWSRMVRRSGETETTASIRVIAFTFTRFIRFTRVLLDPSRLDGYLAGGYFEEILRNAWWTEAILRQIRV